MKNIYLIRHGMAQHNTLFNKYGVNIFYNPYYLDTKLVEEGHKQSKDLKNSKILNNIDLVLTSSLSRCLQTTYNIFSEKNIPIIALDILKEYPQGLQTCNRRSDIDILIPLYPQIDFSNIIHNEDILWNEKKEETIDELNKRIKTFKNFLKNRSEKNIAIVGHSSFFGQFKDNKISYIENGDKELEHCFPYKMTID